MSNSPYLIEKLQYLMIGTQGENDAVEIKIDMTSWVEELRERYPNLTFHVLFKPYNSSTYFPVVSTYDADTHILTWTVTLSSTLTEGVGYTEIRALDVPTTGLVKKSRIIPTTVESSVSGVEGGTVPAPYEDWENLVLSYKDSAASSATSAGISASTAETYSRDAEAWAKGTRNGTPVVAPDPAKDNHSKYWAENAREDRIKAEIAAGIAIAQAGQIYFEIASNGHLMLYYTDEVPISEERLVEEEYVTDEETTSETIN